MTRPHRFDEPGFLHFITNRGTGQTMIARSDHDRRRLLALLGELEPRFDVRVIAYVVMGNHYHMIVQSNDGRLAEAMQFLDGQYARSFNRAHGRSGALFQGRYDDRVICDERHAERAGAYLHLNPLNAGLIGDPMRYPWSSFDAYVSGRSPLPWLRLDLLMGRSGPGYRQAVLEEIDDVTRIDANCDDDIHAWCVELPRAIEQAFRASDEAVAAAFGTTVDEIYVVVRGRTNVVRMAAVARALRVVDRPVPEVAHRYGLRSSSSVRSAVGRLRSRAEVDLGLATTLGQVGLIFPLAA